MMEVSTGKFNTVLDGMRFVEIQFHKDSNELWGNSKFYAVEVGNDVLVVQKWNNDFCTSSFRIPDAQIISCNGQYTIMPYAMDHENVSEKPELPESNEYDDQEASLAERFAAIEDSNSNDGPPLHGFYDEEPSPRIDKLPESVKVNIPTGERPVMTKGRAKPEEMEKTPAPEKVVRVDRPPQPQKPVNGPRDYEPEPPKKPKFDFGDW